MLSLQLRCLTCGANATGHSSIVTSERCDDERTIVELSKCIVNSGDSVLRYCSEQKQKLSKVAAIIITSLSPHNISGLAGILLSLSGLGVGEITIAGPSGLAGYIDHMSPFVNRKYPVLTIIEVIKSQIFQLPGMSIALEPMYSAKLAQNSIACGAIITATKQEDRMLPGIGIIPISSYFSTFPSKEDLVKIAQTRMSCQSVLCCSPIGISDHITDTDTHNHSNIHFDSLLLAATFHKVSFQGRLSDSVMEFPAAQSDLNKLVQLCRPLVGGVLKGLALTTVTLPSTLCVDITRVGGFENHSVRKLLGDGEIFSLSAAPGLVIRLSRMCGGVPSISAVDCTGLGHAVSVKSALRAHQCRQLLEKSFASIASSSSCAVTSQEMTNDNIDIINNNNNNDKNNNNNNSIGNNMPGCNANNNTSAANNIRELLSSKRRCISNSKRSHDKLSENIITSHDNQPLHLINDKNLNKVCNVLVATGSAVESTGTVINHLTAHNVNSILSAPPPLPSDCFDVTFLGTGSAAPSKHRSNSCIMLRLSVSNCQHSRSHTHPITHDVRDCMTVLLDAGDGCSAQLFQSVGGDIQRFDNILLSIGLVWISHHHADHICGLPMLLQHIHQALQRRNCQQHNQQSQVLSQHRPLLLIAPKQVLSYVQYAALVCGLDEVFTPLDISATQYAGSTSAVQEATMGCIERLCSIRVQHCFDSFAAVISLSNGMRLVYSGDCRPSEALVKAGLHCDLLIHEATFDDSMSADALCKRHCTVAEAMIVAGRMRAKHVVLTHFSQRYPSSVMLPTHSSSSSSLSSTSSLSLQAVDKRTAVPQPESVGPPRHALAYDFLKFSFPSQMQCAKIITTALAEAMTNFIGESLDKEVR